MSADSSSSTLTGLAGRPRSLTGSFAQSLTFSLPSGWTRNGGWFTPARHGPRTLPARLTGICSARSQRGFGDMSRAGRPASIDPRRRSSVVPAAAPRTQAKVEKARLGEARGHVRPEPDKAELPRSPARNGVHAARELSPTLIKEPRARDVLPRKTPGLAGDMSLRVPAPAWDATLRVPTPAWDATRLGNSSDSAALHAAALKR